MTPLGFTEAWFALGIVDKCVLDEMLVEWDKGDDPHPRHYRWSAFGRFLARSEPLSPAMAVALFDLGASESDLGIGTAMMSRIVHLQECPEELLRRASTCDRSYVALAALRRVEHSRRANA